MVKTTVDYFRQITVGFIFKVSAWLFASVDQGFIVTSLIIAPEDIREFPTAIRM